MMTSLGKIGLLLLLALWGAETGQADEKQDAGSDVPSKYYLSPTGKKRAQDNISTLTLNIKDAENNLVAIDKNVKTLQGELTELDSLEREHNELKGRLDKYLADARARYQKNEESRKNLLAYEKEVDSSNRIQAESKVKLKEKLTGDKLEFERWKQDTTTKVKRVNELLFEIKESMAQVDARRNKLKEEFKLWQTRRTEYEALLKHYRDKKAEFDLIVKEHSPDAKN